MSVIAIAKRAAPGYEVVYDRIARKWRAHYPRCAGGWELGRYATKQKARKATWDAWTMSCRAALSPPQTPEGGER